jgi:sortase A
MRDHQDGRPGSRGDWLLRWAARLFVVSGAALLIWCAALVIDARVSQRAAQRSLESASLTRRATLPPLSAAPTESPLPDRTVRIGAAIGALSIPRVHLSAVVLHGSDARTLRRGPGHLEHSALPGDAGNVVIAGHRDSFFWPLRNIERGDDIFLDTPTGRYRYRVTSLRVVKSHDLSVLEPTDDATLTLITCYPFWVLGNAPDRFVVRAARVVDQTAVAFEPDTSSPPESGRAAVVEADTASESIPPTTSTASDDKTLVRHAIERFRPDLQCATRQP